MGPPLPYQPMPLNAGARVGPYEVVGLRGSGGMGEVYEARDTRLDRSVAIKILASSERVTPRQLERFQREARAISRVSHSHICTLHDIGYEDGAAFLVMELLEGETLAERVARGPVPLDRALAIGAQIADALDAAHRHGVIHRDLKPTNVMLTRDGVKLLDFGVAKLHEVDPDDALSATKSVALTEEGTWVGTLHYMSPEQVEGSDIDARTDIFALGVVLHEMTTGRRPFQGKSRASLAAAILTEDPPSVSSIVPLAPASLDRIVRKCLAKDPDERWQSARDLASELRWMAEGDTGRGVRAPRLRHLRVVRPALLLATLLGAAAGAATVWGLSARGFVGSPTTPVPRFTKITFRHGTVSSARFAPDGDTVVYSAAWQGKPHELFMTRQGSRESRALGVSHAKVFAVSSNGDLALLRGTHQALALALPFPRRAARSPACRSREVRHVISLTTSWLLIGFPEAATSPSCAISRSSSRWASGSTNLVHRSPTSESRQMRIAWLSSRAAGASLFWIDPAEEPHCSRDRAT
jgi:eukaryotic-like serine/threonine-protein kinase